jgi:hypothetical protein
VDCVWDCKRKSVASRRALTYQCQKNEVFAFSETVDRKSMLASRAVGLRAAIMVVGTSVEISNWLRLPAVALHPVGRHAVLGACQMGQSNSLCEAVTDIARAYLRHDEVSLRKRGFRALRDSE